MRKKKYRALEGNLKTVEGKRSFVIKTSEVRKNKLPIQGKKEPPENGFHPLIDMRWTEKKKGGSFLKGGKENFKKIGGKKMEPRTGGKKTTIADFR